MHRITEWLLKKNKNLYLPLNAHSALTPPYHMLSTLNGVSLNDADITHGVARDIFSAPNTCNQVLFKI